METNQVKEKLKERWKIDPFNFWIPLEGIVIENTCYFDTRELEGNIGYEPINEIINSIEEELIYEFNELKEERIISKLEIKGFSGIEKFYTNENADWVIYQSHEQTIGFAGKELIERIINSWKDGNKYVNPWGRAELTSKEIHDIEISKRKPIWKALSFLYLDTELQDSDYHSIVESLIESKKSIKDLKEIDLFEVFPNLRTNLLDVAGVWSEFDEDWLNKRCEEAYEKRNDYFRQLKVRFYSKFYEKMRIDFWIEIEKRTKTSYNKR